MELNKTIELNGTPSPADDLAKEWSQPTQEKTPGAVNDNNGGTDHKTQSADFDQSIPHEPEADVITESTTPKEEIALEQIAKQCVVALDFIVTEVSTMALRRTLLNEQDRKTLVEVLAQHSKEQKVLSEYEDWLLKQAAQIQTHHDRDAPFSPAEKEMLIEPFKPVINDILIKMKQKASPGLALAIAIVQVSGTRLLPAAGAMVNKSFVSKPSYSRAADVTNS